MALNIEGIRNSWDILRDETRPIFMYGMGLGAEKILKVFEEKGIACAGFFASEDFVRGHEFKGHKVHSLKEIEETVDDFVIVLAFAAGYESLYSKIMDIAARHTLLAPDVPVAGDGLFTLEYFKEHETEFNKVYNLLADEGSRKTYENIIKFKISGDPKFLELCTSPREEVWTDIVKLRDNEVFVDLGAYKGDTVEEFVSECGKAGVNYSKIYALEPNTKNFGKLHKNTEALRDIEIFNGAAWDSTGEVGFTDNEGRMARVKEGSDTHSYAVDDIVDMRATLIKLDVEGAEMRAINGAAEQIRGGADIMCALYHRNEDMFALPLRIHELDPELKLYVRHELYIPAWETNLYAVKGR